MKINYLNLQKNSNASFSNIVNEINQIKTIQKNNKNVENETIKGVLLNNYIQKQNINSDFLDFDKISQSFLIPEKITDSKNKDKEKIQDDFNVKKIIKPLAITTGVTVLGAIGISSCLKSYSNNIIKKSGIVRPPDLATNFNVLEEPHFGFYKALREPTTRNILGFAGVCLMSGITLAAKTLVDGISEVWIKKQKCDIEQDFQKNMISIECEAFSGKLNIVNSMLKNTSEYFKKTFSKSYQNTFGKFLNFKGNEANDKKNKIDKVKLILGTAGIIAGIGTISLLMFKNFQKTTNNFDEFAKIYTDIEIKNKIQSAIKNNDKNSAIKQLSFIFKTINATEDSMKKNLEKINDITPEEIDKVIKEIQKEQIYVKASEALGGVGNKIQYYSYLNEERGLLYNWILNPDNPFNKYLFVGFSIISSIGYISKKIAQSIKEVAVEKENAKNELNLKKNLVAIEIENFKVKKESTISPLMDSFQAQLNTGKSKEELVNVAQNILLEIKNGPPYVYS